MKKTIIYIFCVLGVLISLILIFYFTGGMFAPRPPDAEISLMLNAVASARRSNADEFAKKDYAECMELYDSAMNEWKLQNEKWILRRDFSKLKMQVRQSTEYANMAARKAIQTKGSLKDYIDINISELKERDNAFRTKYQYLPLGKEVFITHSTAHLKLLEAIEAYKGGNLSSTYNQLIEAENGFYSIEKEAVKVLNSYFKSFKLWEKWFIQTLKESKTNKSIAIVIDKIAHKCLLVKNGEIVRQYDAELSPKWLGGKNYQGDDATPEGLYYITKKLNSRQTKFHKALLINYPNEVDKKRYEQAVRSGAIPKLTGIGSLIEIHGDGGKGKDWTNGCIALTNNDMDHLYSMVKTGVPVTIVGSTVPLNQLFTD